MNTITQTIKPCESMDAPFVFISYAHKDDIEVFKILELMEKNHFTFWYDEGLLTGAEWSDEIAKHIKQCVQFVVFISENAVVSHNVKNEINLAAKYNKNILRIHLDHTELTDGLELTLDRRQALLRYKYNESEFNERFCAAIDSAAVKPIPASSRIAEEAFMQNYTLLHQIGCGGSGKVYLAKNLRTGATVAVKHGIVDETITGKTVRFAYETEKAVLVDQISCFTPTLIDYFSDDSNIYLVENVVHGTSLADLDFQSEREIIEIIIRVAKILKKYHQHGVIYCDLKPQHIICDNETCFLIDFGACWRADQDTLSENRMIGTPGYAAPEQYCSYNSDMDLYGEETVTQQVGSDKIDCRTDIYGLGQVLYRIISGMFSPKAIPIRHPRDNTSMENDMFLPATTSLPFKSYALFNQKAYNHNEYSYVSNINPLLRAVIDKMTCERKVERFGDMDEVIEALSAYLRTIV